MRAILLALGGVLLANQAQAHAAEQGFVLLLPTDVYISAGAASVALTVILLAWLPEDVVARVFRPRALFRHRRGRLRVLTSLVSVGLLWWLVSIGLTGSRDPLANPLPLFVWTLWWIGFVSVQGLIGNLWAWVNPWHGPVILLRAAGVRAPLHLPGRAMRAGAIIGYLGLVAFLLADIAPSDPGRLAWFVGAYWLLTLALTLLFGRRWLHRGEPIGALMRAFSNVGIFARQGGRIRVGTPGWQILALRPTPILGAVFMVCLLASGSFDGLNETFWWLAQIGINPLAFPGRSAIVGPTLLGLLAANIALLLIFAATLRLGLMLSGPGVGLGPAFCAVAPTLLPIALAYHVAHFLPSFLVDSQYALKAASDPFAQGADLLGLGEFYVTTGFFNTKASVQVIWLSQAGAVVIGHILAITLAHGVALRLFASTRRAVLSQAPLALFMVAYTFFGLWLLASPRGG